MSKSRLRSLIVLAAMLSALTIVFIFDDVLFYLLFERLLGWRPTFIVRASVWVIILLLNLGLALVVLKALSEKPQTGSESMVGEIGVVNSTAHPYFWVKVRGELWRATSSETLVVGDKVVVRKLQGLTLEVERLHSTSKGGEA